MSEVTYYVALPFVAADDGIAAGEPTECFNPNAAVMRAEALSRKEGHIGAVAFSRTGDPATGDFSDRLRSAKVNVGRCDVFDALMIADVVVVLDEVPNLSFKISW